jgi:hypothetical protein
MRVCDRGIAILRERAFPPGSRSLVTDDQLHDLAPEFRARTPFVYGSAENAVVYTYDSSEGVVRIEFAIIDGQIVGRAPRDAEWKSHATSIRYELAQPDFGAMRAERESFVRSKQNNDALVDLTREKESATLSSRSAATVLQIAINMADRRPRETLTEQLEAVAKPTSTDGMVVVSADLTVLGFGVFFSVPESPRLEVVINDPYEREPRRISVLTELGGARHQSAAVEALSVHGALALVTSADGSLTAMRADQDGILQVNKHLELVLPLTMLP